MKILACLLIVVGVLIVLVKMTGVLRRELSTVYVIGKLKAIDISDEESRVPGRMAEIAYSDAEGREFTTRSAAPGLFELEPGAEVSVYYKKGSPESADVGESKYIWMDLAKTCFVGFAIGALGAVILYIAALRGA